MKLTTRGKFVVAILLCAVIKAAFHYTLPTECRASHWYSITGYPSTPQCIALQQ